ncbi:MAG: hypothetical protein U1F54_04850 [Burkholderiales bacterium]
MLLISATQGAISYSVGRGPLRGLMPLHMPQLLEVLYAARIVLLALLVLLWIANHKRALFHTVILANAFFTLKMLLDTVSLMGVLGGMRQAAQAMLVDAALMCVANVLIFSIWYWIVDPPGVTEEPGAKLRWAFLFPQRGASLPHYENWSPGYADYLYIAFTTSFAFSPTDALPLARVAKMLMLLQAAISVVTIVAIAGGAVNGLVGSGVIP